MRIFTYIILLALILLGVSFAGLNAELVMINYYIGTNKLPLSLLLIMALAAGGLLGLLVSLIIYVRLKSSNLRLRQRLHLAEEEVANLRAMPLKDDR